MAAALGVAARTYANYERDERVLDAVALTRIVEEGWNANWVLTGEGPERLNDAAAPAGLASHPLRVDLLTLAVELIDSELERAKKVLAPDKRAAAYGLIYGELLEEGEYPSAKVVQLVIKAVA
ncbi:MAG TPA: hypothetical protein VGD42_08850 [Lysobacter sp.]